MPRRRLRKKEAAASHLPGETSPRGISPRAFAALAEALAFLAAWRSGWVSPPAAFLRVCQLRRANPAVAKALRDNGVGKDECHHSDELHHKERFQ